MAYQYCSDGRAYVRLNGCGVLCGGGVVGTAARSTGNGTATAAEACQTCPASFVTGHSVQCCPANTALRAADADTAATGCTGNCGGCCSGCGGGCCGGCSGSDCGCSGDGCGCTCGRSCVTCNGVTNCGSAGNASSTGCTCMRNCANASSTSSTCTCTRNCANTSSTSSTASTRAISCPEAAGVGMVYAVEQSLGDVYQSESALRTGTLFPELNKPLNGRCPGSCNASTPAQQNGFAAWDLRLYMDTHPDDPEALALFNQLSQEAGCGSYATAFLNGTGENWSWTNGPWPWECAAN